MKTNSILLGIYVVIAIAVIHNLFSGPRNLNVDIQEIVIPENTLKLELPATYYDFLLPDQTSLDNLFVFTVLPAYDLINKDLFPLERYPGKDFQLQGRARHILI
ncbi:MAG: hypothetical protein M3Q95_12355 [Bacteroidota bacterium]|nr:hypothetical protein [Bacteroidota bacterium]